MNTDDPINESNSNNHIPSEVKFSKNPNIPDDLLLVEAGTVSVGNNITFAISLLIVRLISLYSTYLYDHAEVYKFWEPLHYISYGKGLFYPYSDSIPKDSPILFSIFCKIVYIMKNVGLSKFYQFFIMKLILVLLSVYAQYDFRKCVGIYFKNTVMKYTSVLLVFCPGLFISSHNFDIESLSSIVMMYCVSCYLSCRSNKFIVTFGLLLIFGSPYASFTIAPLVVCFLLSRSSIVKKLGSFLHLIFPIALGLIYEFYIKSDFLKNRYLYLYEACKQIMENFWNFEYDNTYLFGNMFINFNIMSASVLSSAFLTFMLHLTLIDSPGLYQNEKKVLKSSYYFSVVSLLILVRLYFSSNKSEHILYPFYSFFIVAASLGAASLETIFYIFTKRKWIKKILFFGVSSIFIAFSIARIITLVDICQKNSFLSSGFNKVLKVDDNNDVYFCMGNDFQNFPSHFLIDNRINIRFFKNGENNRVPLMRKKNKNNTSIFEDMMIFNNNLHKNEYFQLKSCQYFSHQDERYCVSPFDGTVDKVDLEEAQKFLEDSKHLDEFFDTEEQKIKNRTDISEDMKAHQIGFLELHYSFKKSRRDLLLDSVLDNLDNTKWSIFHQFPFFNYRRSGLLTRSLRTSLKSSYKKSGVCHNKYLIFKNNMQI